MQITMWSKFVIVSSLFKALQSPDKHFGKAKSVVDGGLEFLNTKKTEADIKEKENPQKHRPGLVRKRAKFSLKPDTR